jgi:hypothetical protein
MKFHKAIKPGDFDYPSDESGHKDMEYDQKTI